MNQLISPSSNFNRVRDGRNAPDAYIDVDLSVISDRIINIAGNSFYADATPSDGNCTVYFQETDNQRGPTPFYVSPGFIARIPFTQIRVVNSSVQAGKKIRLVYGVDIDFQPGSVAQVSINQIASYPIYQPVGALGFGGGTVLLSAAGGAVDLVAAAANTKGFILYMAELNMTCTVAGANDMYMYLTNEPYAPPLTYKVLLWARAQIVGQQVNTKIQSPIIVPAGFRLGYQAAFGPGAYCTLSYRLQELP